MDFRQVFHRKKHVEVKTIRGLRKTPGRAFRFRRRCVVRAVREARSVSVIEDSKFTHAQSPIPIVNTSNLPPPSLAGKCRADPLLLLRRGEACCRQERYKARRCISPARGDSATSTRFTAGQFHRHQDVDRSNTLCHTSIWQSQDLQEGSKSRSWPH